MLIVCSCSQDVSPQQQQQPPTDDIIGSHSTIYQDEPSGAVGDASSSVSSGGWLVGPSFGCWSYSGCPMFVVDFASLIAPPHTHTHAGPLLGMVE